MFARKSNGLLTLSLAVVIALVFVIAGCDQKSQLDSTTPTGTTVTVTASPTLVTSGGTSVIEATVLNDGAAYADQAIVFSATPSGIGFFSADSDTTTASGVAATMFNATSSGNVVISATIEGTTTSGSVSLQVTSTPGGGSGNIFVDATPSLLLANGEDTAQLSITVRDASAQPAPDNTMIKLTAGEKFDDINGDGYWTAGIDSIIYDVNGNTLWDAHGQIPSTATVTGGAGQAVVDYVSGNDAATVYIKITVDDNGITGQTDYSLTLSADASIDNIYLASDSMQLSVKQTGGIETGALRATGYDVNGNAVPEGLVINFQIISGPGGGERLGNVGYGPYPAVTNAQGVAAAPFHAGTASGTVRVRAYADTVLSNAAQVLISAGPPAYIVVGAEHCNVDYWDDVAGINGITAVVSDIYLNPVNDSTVVYFSTDEGTMKSHEERTGDHEGIARTIWISGNNVATANGIVEVYAETAGGTVADTTFFFNSHVPNFMSVTNWQTTLDADGSSKFYCWVSAVDLNGNLVIGGTPFRADANFVGVAGGSFEDGCYSASDRVQVTSKTLDKDWSMTGGQDDGVGAIDNVTFWYDYATGVTQVCSLMTGPAYIDNSKLDIAATATIGETLPIKINVADRYGNPLGDHTLTLVESGGTLVGNTVSTDAFGVATGSSWTATGLGTFTITATDTDPRGGGMVLTAKVKVE
jgi:hypothetical protein